MKVGAGGGKGSSGNAYEGLITSTGWGKLRAWVRVWGMVWKRVLLHAWEGVQIQITVPEGGECGCKYEFDSRCDCLCRCS